MQNRILFLTLAALFALALAACQPIQPQVGVTEPGAVPQDEPPAGGVSPLVETEWRLVSMGPAGSQTEVVEGSEVTIAFPDPEVVRGSAGCNTFSGAYELGEGNAIIFHPLAVTMMACAEAGVMEQETAFLQALEAATSFTLEAGLLFLEGPDSTLIFLAVEAPAGETGEVGETGPLVGAWDITAVTGPDGAEVELVAPANVEFTAQGEVFGTGGCNRMMGGYSTEGDALELGPMAGSMMFCEGVMDQENAVLAALDGTGSFTVDGDTLTINAANGAVLTLTRAAAAADDGSAAVPVGTNWVLEQMIHTGVEMQPLVEGTEITLSFFEEGSLSGNSGCNQYSGGYTVNDDQTVTIGPLMSTLMACEGEGVGEQETAFQAALNATTQIFEEDGKLVLVGPETTLIFVPAE